MRFHQLGAWSALVVLGACSSSNGPAATQHPAPAETRAPAETEALPSDPKVVVAEICDALAITPFEVKQTEQDPQPVPIEEGERLAPFYDKVARLLRGKAEDHIRIAVYGDSNLIADFQTGQMRRRLHERFGDAGHGLVSVGKPWWLYKHMDVVHGSDGWDCHNISTDPAFDRLYGLTGIVAESTGGAAKAYAGTAGPGAPTGTTVDAFEVFYLARKGVTFDVQLDRAEPARFVCPDAGIDGMGVYRVDTEDAPHRLSIIPRGVVRILGVALERKRAAPSFVVDSFGVGAMNSRAQASKKAELETAMLKHRGYDLIIFHTGHNDGFTARETAPALRAMIAMHRAALPDAPILLMTPADRGKNETFYFTRIAVEQRREIAKEQQTAMWDLFRAMGGKRSMARFKARGLAMSDYVHFSASGGAWVGDRLLAALWQDLARHVAKHPRAGCDD